MWAQPLDRRQFRGLCDASVGMFFFQKLYSRKIEMNLQHRSTSECIFKPDFFIKFLPALQCKHIDDDAAKAEAYVCFHQFDQYWKAKVKKNLLN